MPLDIPGHRIVSLHCQSGNDAPHVASGWKSVTEEAQIINQNQKTMEKRDIWKLVIQTLITILTAIGTSLGVVSCM